ncbi:MAG: hypothetical protein IMZ62_17305 [Chloroflexi bacterium]|nr:hypothetical protein [Chloroflexota bacterium]
MTCRICAKPTERRCGLCENCIVEHMPDTEIDAHLQVHPVMRNILNDAFHDIFSPVQRPHRRMAGNGWEAEQPREGEV